MNSIRRTLSYSNVIATIALFIALGGGAYALAKNSVESKHIVNDQVKSADIRDKAVKSAEIKDESIESVDIKDFEVTGDDVDESTLFRAGSGGQDQWAVPIGGAMLARVADIGGSGASLYGGLSGSSTADTDFADVATGTPIGTIEVGYLNVELSAPLAAGQSRTFTVVRAGSLPGSVLATSVTCSIAAGESRCEDLDKTQTNNSFIGVRIQSAGAGLSSSDTAYVGATIKARTDL